MRELNSLEVVIVRFFLHLAMFSSGDLEQIKKVISCQPKDVGHFLMSHLRNDLAQLSKILNRDEETAQLYMMRVLRDVGRNSDRATGQEWNDKMTLGKWEVDFAKKFVRPIKEREIDVDLQNLQAKFKKDLDGAKSATLIILEEPEPRLELTNVWQVSLWRPRTRPPNVESIEHFLGGPQKMKRFCPKFSKLVGNLRTLRAVRELPNIIQVQRRLKNLFDGDLEIDEVSKLTLEEFCLRYPLHGEANQLKRYVSFLHDIGDEVMKNGGAFAARARTQSSQGCAYFFPNERFGALAIAVVDYLVDCHNALVGSETQRQVKLNELAPSDLIEANEDDLNMLILANCRYELGIANSNRKMEPDTAQLESMTMEKYFKHVPKIDESDKIRFFFRNENTLHRGEVLKKLEERIPQEAQLAHNFKTTIENDMHEAREVGKLMSKIEMVSDLMAEVGQDRDQAKSIAEALLRFKINVNTTDCVSKLLRQVTLGQIRAFLTCLALKKAKLLTLKREDPFMGKVSDAFKEPMNEDLIEKLHEFTRHVNPEVGLEVIFALISEQMSGKSESEIEFSTKVPLRDVLYAYLDSIDEDEKSLQVMDFMDASILAEHVTSCFAHLANLVCRKM